MLLELVPESAKDALSVKWLACKVATKSVSFCNWGRSL